MRANTEVLQLQNLLGDIFKPVCKKITDLHKEESIFFGSLLQSLCCNWKEVFLVF